MNHDFDDILLASLAEKVVKYLRRAKKTVAVSESCTGGLLASFLTEWPGSSEIFLGGIAAYSNSAKEQILGVSKTVIWLHGAVSKEVAEEMAVRTKSLFGSNYAIAITGIAGPSGGSEEKPVGTVFHAFSSLQGVLTWENHFQGSRSVVRKKATKFALELLLKEFEDLSNYTGPDFSWKLGGFSEDMSQRNNKQV